MPVVFSEIGPRSTVREEGEMIDRKVVISLAREAGYDDAESHSGRLRAFAFLVMAEACNKMVDDMPNSEIVKAAIEDERQSVLVTIDELRGMESDRNAMFSDGYDHALSHIEEFIRAREQV
jgi:hypothetical protein